jgi:TRAP-type C4-dicarboxylate transport system substrate-binding protein
MRPRAVPILAASTVLGLASILPSLPTLAASPAVTLRFAVSDDQGKPSDAYVRAFSDEVSARTGGTVTLDISWGAGGDAFEQGVAKMLAAGQADIALAAGRAWDDAGVAAFDALQTPFLIDNDALALAVAKSDVATGMLGRMSSANATGLAMWPEDLRHPAAFNNCMGPITAPTDLAGRTVRLTGSAVSFDLIRALGATPIFVNGYGDQVASCQIQAAESGLRQGASLPYPATFTGDVTFFPKFQVLAASNTAFASLTPEQRQALEDAALAVRDRAIAEHPSEVDAANQWCADGGTVVLASPDQVDAFRTAAQPVADKLSADAATKSDIDAITALKAATPASPGASACAPVGPSAAPLDLSGFSGALFPEGSYRATVTAEDMQGAGASSTFASSNWGTKTFTFSGTTVTFDQGEHGGPPCTATMTSMGDYVQVSGSAGGCGIDARYAWRQVGNDIEIAIVRSPGDTDRDYADFQALIHRVWTRID